MAKPQPAYVADWAAASKQPASRWRAYLTKRVWNEPAGMVCDSYQMCRLDVLWTDESAGFQRPDVRGVGSCFGASP